VRVAGTRANVYISGTARDGKCVFIRQSMSAHGRGGGLWGLKPLPS